MSPGDEYSETLISFSIQIEANNERLEQMAREIKNEKLKNDALLREVLPVRVAEQLMRGEPVDAREYPIATVMFTDSPAFQKVVPLCKPSQLVTILNELFTKFDHLVTLHGVCFDFRTLIFIHVF